MLIYIIAIAAGLMTYLGGTLALRFRDKLHLILGFSAGAVLGVAFFDLLPESINLGSTFHSVQTSLLMTAIGFLLYLIVDRFSHNHHHTETDTTHDHGRSNLRAGSLSFHSLLDGLGIGLSFQVSASLGLIVAIAVLAHDFSDGINTVSVVLKRGGEYAAAKKWLLADSIAPIIGVIIAYLFPVSENHLSLLLSLFAGFFLYIGASDLIPESFHGHPTKWTTCMTVLGALVIYLAISIAG
jgi:zinc transporter ZupT